MSLKPFASTSSQAVAEDQTSSLTGRDALTGCITRQALLETMDKLPQDRQLGVIVVDLDHLTAANDHYGTSTGDALLSGFASMTRKILRSTELFARTEEDEFVIVLPGASLDQARQLAQRICYAVAANPMTVGSAVVPLTVSAGATYGGSLNERSIEELISGAQGFLRKAKEGGRNRAVTL